MRGLKYVTTPLALLLVGVLGLSVGTANVFSQEPATEHTVYLPYLASQSDNALSNEVINRVSEEEQARALERWTPERMSNAKLMEAPVLTDAEVAEARSTMLEDMGGEPVAIPAHTVVGAPDDADTAAVDSFPPFTGYPIHPDLYDDFPWLPIGRIFFDIPGFDVIPDFREYSCTAAAINVGDADSAIGDDIIITSASCLYTHSFLGVPVNDFHENMVFVPGYNEGQSPIGVYPVELEAVPREWTGPIPNFAYNFGTAIVGNDLFTGEPLGNRTGVLGLQFNVSPTQHFHAFSYPTSISGAQFLYVCAGSTARFWRNLFGPDSIGIGCNTETIDSGRGGPWLVNYLPFGEGLVNQVNGIGGWQSGQNTLYSSYFGERAQLHISNVDNFPRE